MISNDFKNKINDYKKNDLIFEALQEILDHYHLNHDRFTGFHFREELNPTGLLLTAEGTNETGISIHVPRNILDFELELIANLIMHEVYHIHQRTGEHIIPTREEREWQAYYEMIFHLKFPQIPTLPDFYLLQFGKKALTYYQRMTDELKEKYKNQKEEVEEKITQLERLDSSNSSNS